MRDTPDATYGEHTDTAYLHLLNGVACSPVFIIGDHRSGTTLLYKLLSTTGAFNVVTAYHVIRYGELLANHVHGTTARAQAELAERFAAEGLANRVIDGVRVAPDLPEEYGFVIDRSSRPHTSDATLPRLVELCRKIRFVGGDRPVLLKNPWDVMRFAFLEQAFTGARFIFLHRHPLHVMNSQLEAARSLYAAKNGYVALLSPWYAGLFDRPLTLKATRALATRRFEIGARLVAHHVARVANYYLRHVKSLGRDRYVELRYEDLCADPDRTLDAVLAFLHVERGVAGSVRELVRPRAPHVLPEVRRQFHRGRFRLAKYCEAQRYDLDP